MSKEQIPCKHVRREGESCRLNNNCTYPNCPVPDRGLVWRGLTKGTFKMADEAIKKMEDASKRK